MTRRFILIAVAVLLLAGGCARMPGTGLTPLRPANLTELKSYLLAHKADVDQFRLRGPFAVTVQPDLELRPSAAVRVTGDLYLSSPAEKAPLVILLHGHDNSKEDHAYQALHLATWGMHSLALELPSQGPWAANARTLAAIVKLIHGRPELLDPRIDPGRIVLAGHSFGAAASAIALGDGAPAAGAILLDPAGIGMDLPKFLRRIDKPVMVVGADEQVSRVRNRSLFYESIRSGVADVSIRDAHHEDAQFPMEPAADSHTTEELQITFVSALTSAAFSLGFTGGLDYAWTSFSAALQNGKLFDALRK